MIAIGSCGTYIDGIFTSSIGSMVSMRQNETRPEIRVDFGIQNDDNLCKRLAGHHLEIDEACGEPLCYYTKPGVASRRIVDVLKSDIFDESRWPEHYDWLTERVIRMKDVMGKRL